MDGLHNLQEFVDKLNFSITCNYENQVRKVIEEKIITHLRDQSLSSIDRCSLVGSIAKKTSTPLNPVADVVVFYNEKGQNKEDIIKDFKHVLLNTLGISDIRITRNHTLKFVMDDIPFELSIAQNNTTGNREDVVVEQRRKSMLRIMQTNNYKSSIGELGVQISESSVMFMESKTKLTRDVARLAKYWDQHQLFRKYVHGRSTIIELLATKAALEEENKSHSFPFSEYNYYLMKSFQTFLEYLHQIEEANIVFLEYYDRSDIPVEIIQQRPLLLDPINPYNNLLGEECGYGYGKFEFVPENLIEFKVFISNAAGKTLEFYSKAFDDTGVTDERLITLFSTPPSLIHQVSRVEKRLLPKNYLIGVYSNSNPKVLNLNINSAKSMPDYVNRKSHAISYKNDIEPLIKAYSGFICTYAKIRKNLSDKELENQVKIYVNKRWSEENAEFKKKVYKRPFVENNTEEEKDITIKIPIPLEGDKSVLISFDYHVSTNKVMCLYDDL